METTDICLWCPHVQKQAYRCTQVHPCGLHIENKKEIKYSYLIVESRKIYIVRVFSIADGFVCQRTFDIYRYFLIIIAG